MKKYFTKLIGIWNGVVFANHKLFLCSKDINIGDELQYRGFYNGEDRNETITVTHIDNEHISMSNGYATPIEANGEVFCLGKNAWSVVGEISPAAKWVKEGYEFDENEVKKIVYLEIYHADADPQYRDEERELRVGDTYIPVKRKGYEEVIIDETIKVLGPCGHFH